MTAGNYSCYIILSSILKKYENILKKYISVDCYYVLVAIIIIYILKLINKVF